jgi:hypothetical protein
VLQEAPKAERIVMQKTKAGRVEMRESKGRERKHSS